MWRGSCLGAPSSAGEQPLPAIFPWLSSHIAECVCSVAVIAVGTVGWSVAALEGQGPRGQRPGEKGPPGGCPLSAPTSSWQCETSLNPFCPLLHNTQPTAVISRTFYLGSFIGNLPTYVFLVFVLCFIKGVLDVAGHPSPEVRGWHPGASRGFPCGLCLSPSCTQSDPLTPVALLQSVTCEWSSPPRRE